VTTSSPDLCVPAFNSPRSEGLTDIHDSTLIREAGHHFVIKEARSNVHGASASVPCIYHYRLMNCRSDYCHRCCCYCVESSPPSSKETGAPPSSTSIHILAFNPSAPMGGNSTIILGALPERQALATREATDRA
jgi:hypothetical protein